MITIGSIKGLEAGKTTGFVGYPREYVIGATASNSFIRGVDQAGDPFILELSIPERFIEEAKKKTDISIPEVASLAETHRKARNPCFCAPDNGPVTMSGGVFLAEQVQVVDKAKNHYKANWLSILRDVDDAPKPRAGIGFLEINSKLAVTAEAEEMRVKLIAMNQAFKEATLKNPDADTIMGMSTLEFSAERDALAHSLYNSASKQWFIGVDVQYHLLERLNMSDELGTRKRVVDMISGNTVSGMYGGVILRPVQRNGEKEVVIVDSVRKLNHQFDYTKGEIPTADSVWSTFVEKGGSGWLKTMKAKGYDVEVIPVQRVNCGPVSNQKYTKEMVKGGFSKQIKAFVDTRFHHAPYVNFGLQNGYLACPIAMRTAETRKSGYAGTVLLSSIHSFGKAIGNVLELNSRGERALKLSQLPEPFVKGYPKRASDMEYSQ